MKLKNQIKLMSGWQTEWCPYIPKYEDGEYNFDSAEYKIARFKTREEAVAKAKEVAKLDWFGGARIREFEYVPLEYERGYYEIQVGEIEDEVLASEIA